MLGYPPWASSPPSTGSIVPAEEARVSVLDNGFTFGDSVYETLRTYGGRPFELGTPPDAGCAPPPARLGFAIPARTTPRSAGTRRPPRRAAGNSESYIRFIVSRGVGDISYHFDRVKGPTVVMVVKPLEPFPESHYREGIDVAVVTIRRNHPQRPRPRDQVLQPAEQHPGRARGPGPGRRGGRCS